MRISLGKDFNSKPNRLPSGLSWVRFPPKHNQGLIPSLGQPDKRITSLDKDFHSKLFYSYMVLRRFESFLVRLSIYYRN